MRKNIGFVIDNVDGVFTKHAAKGAELGSIAIDANLFIFPGRYLHSASVSYTYMPYEYQYNTLFQFAADKQLDILFVLVGVIGACVEEEQRRLFLEQYLGIPVVILFMDIEGYNSVMFENTPAFMEGIRHIIQDKGARKVGYISGPKTNTDAQERLDCYKRVLEESGIALDEDLIVYGDFADTCEPDIYAFIKSHTDLDAIIFANDLMAKSGYHCMKKLGLRPGEDILVMGFDNSDFSATMEPPLTTVEANAVELAYKAVLNTEQYLKSDNIQKLRVDTHLIHRASCGCIKADYRSLAERLHLNQITDVQHHPSIVKRIFKYLYGEFIESEIELEMKQKISQNVSTLADYIASGFTAEYEQIFVKKCTDYLFYSTFRYTTLELYMNVLSSILFCLQSLTKDFKQEACVMHMFANIYHEIALANFKLSQTQAMGFEQLSNVVNALSIDISQKGTEDQTDLSFVLSQLSSVGILSSYLYTFEKPIHNIRYTVFKKPNRFRFSAYSRGEVTTSIPWNEQDVPVSYLVCNPKMQTEQRATYIVNPLFAQEMLYGLLVCEVTLDSFSNVATVANHISMIMQTIYMLNKQRENQKQLQENLDTMSKSNMELSAKSKSDQLTGLYNRWGFMERVQEAISNPENIGKSFMVLFADMDNLKMVNDQYGHDEGDFALREIASILKDSLGASDAIARFGGDEFVAFALHPVGGHEETTKKKIAQVTQTHNLIHPKPYRVEMSTGIFETTCKPDIIFQNLLYEADKKLYIEKREKKAGRDF